MNARKYSLTGFGRSVDVEQVTRAGVAAHFTKPLDLETLAGTLSRIGRRNAVLAVNVDQIFQYMSAQPVAETLVDAVDGSTIPMPGKICGLIDPQLIRQ